MAPHDVLTPEQAHRIWSVGPGISAEPAPSHVELLSARIATEIIRSVPEFSVPDMSVATVVDLFVSDLLGPGPDAGGQRYARWQDACRRAGRTEFELGRTLEAHQAACRAGGRAGWRYVTEQMPAQDLVGERLRTVVDAIFVLVDDACRLGEEGYAQARAQAAGQQDARRGRLLQVLLDPIAPTPEAVAQLAAAAGWRVPSEVVVVALEPRPDDDDGTVLALDGDVLRRLTGPRPCLVTGDPEAHLARLAHRLGGRRAAIGPATPVTLAAQSLACAERALELAGTRVLGEAAVIDSADHLMELWMAGDRFLLDRLCSRVLRPLGTLPAGQGVRLAETLMAWLECRGNSIRMAEQLDIHPQTVRYRMQQVHELFGDQLDDPARRHEMETVLRAYRLLLLPDVERGWQELRDVFPGMPEMPGSLTSDRVRGIG